MSCFQTAQAILASLLAKATAALLCPMRFSRARAQVRSRLCCLVGFALWAWHRIERAPWISSLLYRLALVPRALAAIGLVATMLQIAGITLPVLLGYSVPLRPEFFGMPLGLAYLVLALWLMTKGFEEGHGPLPADARGVELSGG